MSSSKKQARQEFIANLTDSKSEFHSEPYRIDITKYPNKQKRKEKLLQIINYYQSEELKKEYKEDFLEDFVSLKQEFPNIDFDFSGRFKSFPSCLEKMHRKIRQGGSGNSYDFFASKIVIYSIDGKTEEEELIKACYQMRDFLASYRSTTPEFLRKRKDYIQKPKTKKQKPQKTVKAKSNIRKKYVASQKITEQIIYQALHLTRIHQKKFASEVQIRTFRMEEAQQYGASSHDKIYKKGSGLKNIPTFLSITQNRRTGLFQVYETDPETAKQLVQSYRDALE